VSSYAVINDLYPCLSSTTVKWSQTAGVEPFEMEVDLVPDHADALVRLGLSPITLKIGDGKGSELVVSRLYVLSRTATQDKHIAKVLIVDRRWFWTHTHVARHFNMLRVAGSKRHREPDTPLELQPLSADVSYKPFSLNGGRLWTATEALGSVLEQCLGPEGGGLNYTVDPSIGTRLDNLPLVDVELDDPGDQALRRILSYLPEAAVTVRPDGTVAVYSLASGTEEPEIIAAGEEAYAGGHVEWIDLSNIRPSAIHVLFTREHEIRFDFEETDAPTAPKDDVMDLGSNHRFHVNL